MSRPRHPITDRNLRRRLARAARKAVQKHVTKELHVDTSPNRMKTIAEEEAERAAKRAASAPYPRKTRRATRRDIRPGVAFRWWREREDGAPPALYVVTRVHRGVVSYRLHHGRPKKGGPIATWGPRRRVSVEEFVRDAAVVLSERSAVRVGNRQRLRREALLATTPEERRALRRQASEERLREIEERDAAGERLTEDEMELLLAAEDFEGEDGESDHGAGEADSRS